MDTEITNNKYEYDKEDIELFQYLIRNWKEIGEEYRLQGKGKIIQDMVDPMHGIIKDVGFECNITNSITIHFLYKNGECSVKFFYQEIEIMTVYLRAQVYLLEDGYGRSDNESRHDLKKGFDFFINHVKKDLYEPYIKNIEEQKLHKDKMFDEYLEKISDTSRFLD
jgi:hypothetical protein